MLGQLAIHRCTLSAQLNDSIICFVAIKLRILKKEREMRNLGIVSPPTS